MAGRRTNLALTGLLIGAAATGVAAFAIGTPHGRWVVVAHAILGIGVVALAPWKSVVARRGLARRRSGTTTSVVLSIAVGVTLVSGFLQALGAASRIGPLTTMQVHVGSALIALALTAAHVRRRPTRPRQADLSRRNTVRAVGLLAVAAAAYGSVEVAQRLAGTRGANRRFTGSHERGSFDPAAMPVTQWIDDRVQHIAAEHHRLIVRDPSGERSVDVAELERHDDRLVATLDCTGGWYATQEWAGARLDRIVDTSEATSIVVVSATGYQRRFPATDAAHLLLATRAGNRALSAGHGAPVRLVAPGRRGFWWVKWVTEVSAEDRPSWLQLPFPIT